MKKLIYVLLVLSVVFVSCGGGGGGGGGAAPAITNSSTTTTNTSTTTTTPTYFGTKSPTDPKAVNDIVFSDGSATPYTSGLTLTAAQKNAAVAMIFYKGTECSNNGSTRTLGVGLKRSTSGNSWCLHTANGYNTNIIPIQCTPSGSPGAYTFTDDTDDKDGSDNFSQLAAFLAGTGINDTGTAGNYPAFDWAKNYGSTNGCTGAYADGWYLPSIAELYQIYNQRTSINAAVALCGLTVTFNTSFRSSSQCASYDNNAYVLFFNTGYCNSDDKPINVYVCAVREF